MVKVFTYETPAGVRSPRDIAEDAFTAFNDAPRSDEAAALARQDRQRRLRWDCNLNGSVALLVVTVRGVS